ncbi:MAG: T9SS type A sorting domain-containing protein [Chitinophagaceae bacterium]|nr:MAG: T9SS type A sorting domain-containing protein [Chitinophagaceae bacterium]
MKPLLLFLSQLVFNFYGAHAQITTPAIKANFGVEADPSANFYNSSPTAAVDDWFNNSLIGSGMGMIDSSGAAAILAGYISNPASRKSSFSRLMAFPPYALVNNRIVLDAVYHRDYHGDDSTVFGFGSNKNGMSPAAWASPGPASIPDKNDILDAMVHVRRAGPNARDSLWMFAALSLENTTGNRFFDFELYQTDITFNYNTRTFSGYGPNAGHTSWKFDASGNIVSPGDIIFTAEFSSSALTFVEARIWIDKFSMYTVPAAFNWSGQFDGAASGAQYGYASIRPKTAGAFYTGLQNPSTTWAGPFQLVRDNNTVVPAYTVGQFMELSINLSKLGIEPADFANSPCGSPFRRVLIKTRSSTSFTSELKDFVAPFRLFDYPAVDAFTELTYFCGVMPVTPISVHQPNPSSIYTWTTTNGHIVGSSSGTTIMVDAPGTYYVTQQLHLQCSFSSRDSVTIFFDQQCTILNLDVNLAASKVSGINKLKWQVNSNELTNHYTIEYSVNNTDFFAVANRNSAPGAGITNYEYNHESGLVSPVIYYRIKVTDTKGAIKYSNTVALKNHTGQKNHATIFPNPTKGNLFLSYEKAADETGTLLIINATGQIIKQSKLPMRSGQHLLTLDNMSSFADGIYTVRLITTDGIISQKIILKK